MNKKPIVTSHGRNKNLNDEIKKYGRTGPDKQLKNFPLTKQKLDLELTMSELGKSFTKKNQIKNFLKKLKINVKMPHLNKNKREGEILFKQKTRPGMNDDWIGKPIRSKFRSKIRNKK